jgi:DNA repair protein RadA/Sms
VRLRADRIGAIRDDLMLAAETDLAAVLGHVDAVGPSLLVVDSVQTIASAEVDGSPGNVSQVREVAAALIRVAKDRGIATVLVGHVTKDGSVAGPRLLEHLVDVVLQFEGDRHSRLRMVRGIKNRYGPSDEVGCFDLSDDGIEGLADPSGLFLSQRREAVAGTCVTVTVEGKRPLVAEVQALLAPSHLTSPRRTTSGLDGGRLAMVLAVLQRRGGERIRMSTTAASDVYASTVGGVRLTEPATDLAVALAVAGAAQNEPLATGLVAVGEVGLAGDIRRVTATSRRLAEAARLGFTHALVPPDPGRLPPGITAIEVTDLAMALRVAFPGAEVIPFGNRRAP